MTHIRGMHLVDEERRCQVSQLIEIYEEHTGRPVPFSPLEVCKIWEEYSYVFAAGWMMRDDEPEEVVRVIDGACAA